MDSIFSESRARPGTRRFDPYWQPWKIIGLQLWFSVVLLLGAVTTLTLYGIVGEAFKLEPEATDWKAFLSEASLTWLLSLAPLAILMPLISGAFPRRVFARIILLGFGVICSAVAGTLLSDLLLGGADTVWLLANARDLVADAILVVLPAGLMASLYEFRRKNKYASEAALRVQAEQIAIEAELTKARLSLLRAQIEPHFIFNSLAHVRRLYQIDVNSGNRMLDSLIRYFTGALPSLRQETCTLAEEAALIGAYLDIHRHRMGSRLGYAVVFPPELLALRVPSMVLLTLVENAIKHGLSPLREGGSIRISTQVSGDLLELRVADSGGGMTVSSGQGTGLANIRARLSAIYGSAATLTLSTNRPRGITASVRLPLRSLTT